MEEDLDDAAAEGSNKRESQWLDQAHSHLRSRAAFDLEEAMEEPWDLDDWADRYGDLYRQAYEPPKIGVPPYANILLGRPELDEEKFPVLDEDEKAEMLYRLSDMTDFLAEQLFVCRHCPNACQAPTLRFKLTLASQAHMQSNLFGMGSALVCMSVCVCLVAGFAATYRRSRCVLTKVAQDWFTSGARAHANCPSRPWHRSIGLPPLCAYARQFLATLGHYLDDISAWWLEGPAFSHALVTVKLYVCALLCIELLGLSAPEQSALATPELIAAAGRRLPWTDPAEERHELVPPMAAILLPRSPDDWVDWLHVVRQCLILAWCTFLTLPEASGNHALQVLLTLCYMIGALAYVYLGTIGLMFCLSHTLQGTLLFVLATMVEMPAISCKHSGGAWLRTVLLVDILIPIYLFAGISKLRYSGIAVNFTGSWIAKYVQEERSRSSIPELTQEILQSQALLTEGVPWLCTVLSWGNLVVELLLPLLVLFTIHGSLATTFQLVFFVGIAAFHFAVFLLLGPNFARQLLLLLIASDPLGWMSSTSPSGAQQGIKKVEDPAVRDINAVPGLLGEVATSQVPMRTNLVTWPNKLRVLCAVAVHVGWWTVQFASDLSRIFHLAPASRHFNPYFPFPELSMYADITPDANFALSFCLCCTIVAGFIGKVSGDLRLQTWKSKES